MITYKNVTKTYGELIAVNDLNMEVQRGEFFCLLGPNGAGKTTIMRMTATLTPLTSGTIEINGQQIHRDLTETKSKFGIVPQYSNLEGELTAYQNLAYHGKLYGIHKDVCHTRIGQVLEFFGLTDRQNDRARFFSGGMQRKLMIAKALMHDPEILLLDEPTVGLDATTRRKIWDYLHTLRRNGLTIVMTTHYLEEAQILCERVGLIDEGKLAMIDTPEKIIKRVGKFVIDYFKNGETHQRFFEDRESAITAAASIEGDFKVRESNLEDVFIKLTNKNLGARYEI